MVLGSLLVRVSRHDFSSNCFIIQSHDGFGLVWYESYIVYMWFECIAKRIRSLHDSAYSNQNFKSNTWHTIARVKNNQNNASSLASMLFWHCTLHVDYITTSSALCKLHDMFHAKFSRATHATRLSTSKNNTTIFQKEEQWSIINSFELTLVITQPSALQNSLSSYQIY